MLRQEPRLTAACPIPLSLLPLAQEGARRPVLRGIFGDFPHRREVKEEGGLVSTPALPAQGDLRVAWPGPGNWESGCVWTHWPARAAPTPRTAGGLLIRRDSCQSHSLPLIKQTSISSGRKRVEEAQSWGCPHLGWKH